MSPISFRQHFPLKDLEICVITDKCVNKLAVASKSSIGTKMRFRYCLTFNTNLARKNAVSSKKLVSVRAVIH